ncbi:hypothetical protein JCM10449v2_001987 [Rhodotorula kratochvilovae]
MPDPCASCGASDSLEYAPELGTLACTRCGTVSSSSATHAFEFLGRVDAEDDYQNGRTYVGAHGGAYGGVGAMAARRAGAKVGSWTKGAEGGAGIYQAQKRTEAELYIRRLLARFDLLTALRDRTRHLFERAKARLDFRWGRKSEIFGAACVYIAAREAKKPVWLNELASLIEVKDINVLTRAVRVVKFELKVEYQEDDPTMFIERILVHLNKVFSPSNSTASTSSSKSPPPPPLHAADKRKTTFAPANATWIRSIQLPAVRDLATGLLALATDESLTAGRPAESVAAAVVIASLEGTARRAAPVVQEFAAELAWAVGSAEYAVMERYRELNRLLVDYAAKLPWNAPGATGDDDAVHITQYGRPDKRRQKKKEKPASQRVGRKVVKTEVVAHTADVVAFRKTLACAKPQPKPLRLDGEAGDGDDSVTPVGTTPGPPNVGEEEGDDESMYTADPLVNQTAASRYYASRTASPSLEPAASAAGSPVQFRLPSSPLASSRAASLSPAPVPAPSQPAPAPVPAAAASATKKKAKKRASPYARENAPPKPRRGALARSERGSATPAPSPALAAIPTALDPQVRQLLLAGVDLATAARQLRGLSPSDAPLAAVVGGAAEPTTRLGRLLWAKPADEIADDELFDAGELEAYVRPRDEARALLALPRTKEMISVDERHTAAREGRPSPPPSSASKRRSAMNPRYRFSAPRDAMGNFLVDEENGGAAGGGRKRRAGTAETDGFRPRKKRSKITNREALEAYLAKDAISDDEGAADAGAGAAAAAGGDAPWMLGMAIQAAQDEGEDVAEDDGDDGEQEGEAGDDDDWRQAYGKYRAVEEEEVDDY